MKKLLIFAALAAMVAIPALAEEPVSAPVETEIPEMMFELAPSEDMEGEALFPEAEETEPEVESEVSEAADPLQGVVSSVTLGVGEKYAIAPDGADLTFKTSKKKVATVDAQGVVQGKKTGKATITVTTPDGRTATCAVTVVKAPKSVTLKPASLALSYDTQSGARLEGALIASTPKGTASRVWFDGYDESVINVLPDGTVIPVGAGTTSVTVETFNGRRATSVVTVYPGPEAVSLESEAMTLMTGQTEALRVNAPVDIPLGLRFDTSDLSVVSVDEVGTLQAHSVGEAVVTARAFNGVYATCRVKVIPGPAEINLEKTSIKLGVGETARLTAAITDIEGNPMDCALTVKSSAAAVKVFEDGTIKGAKRGSATLTFTAPNGLSTTCKVTVAKAPSKVKLNTAKIVLKYDGESQAGESARLTVKLSSGSASAITYSGYDPQVVQVDESGLVTAVGYGTTRVTASAFNGKSASCVVAVQLSDNDVKNYRSNHPLIAVAHRGGRAYWPENTLEAFSHSESTGADMIELDARTTKDGIEVVHHDPSFKVEGKQYTISKCSYATLKAAKPTLCTLDEALDLIANATRLDIQLELKDTADPQKCVEAVERSGMAGRTWYISFELPLLRKVRKLDGAARLGYIFSGSVPSKLMETVAELNIRALMVHQKLLTQERLDGWHRYGMLVNVWTINDQDACIKFANMGVDFITSDYPDYAVNAKS